MEIYELSVSEIIFAVGYENESYFRNRGNRLMKERILAYLEEYGSITTFEAFTELGCSRLSEYIRQLKKTHVIRCEWLLTTNRYGDQVRYKRYWLEEGL